MRKHQHLQSEESPLKQLIDNYSSIGDRQFFEKEYKQM